MSKETFLDIYNEVRPLISKDDIKYRKAIPIEIKISCIIYKLAKGANILTCNELFAIGRSTITFMLWEMVTAIKINHVTHNMIKCYDGVQELVWYAKCDECY